MALRLVALLALASMAQAIYIFRAEHCNTLWNNPNNWMGERLPQNDMTGNWTAPRRVVLGKQGHNFRPVDSLVNEGTNVLGEIVFGDASALTLGPGQVEFVFERAENVGTWSAYFEAGQEQTRECDIGCTSNFVLGTEAELNAYSAELDETLPVPQAPACSDDVVAFPPHYSSKVFARGVYDWERLIISGTTYNTRSGLATLGTTPVMMVPRPVDADIRLNDVQACHAEGLYDPLNAQCKCFDTCSASTADMETLARAACLISEERILDAMTPQDYEYRVSFLIEDGTPMARHRECLAEDASWPARLLRFAGVHAANATATVDADTFTVAGMLHGEPRSLDDERLTYGDVDPSNPPAPVSANTDRLDFVLHMYEELVAAARACERDACVDDARDTQCPTDVDPDASIMIPCEHIALPLFLLSDPVTAAQANLEAWIAGKPEDMSLVECAPASSRNPCPSAMDMLSGFMNHKNTPPATTLRTLLANAFEALSVCVGEANVYAAQFPDVPTHSGSVSGLFGEQLSQAHVNRLTDEYNADRFAWHLARGLDGYASIVSTDPEQIKSSFVFVDPHNEDPADPARRADDNNQFGRASTLLWLQIDYESLDAAIAKGTSQYDDMVQWIRDLVNSYQLQTHQCFTLADGWDLDCLIREIRQAGCRTKQCVEEEAQRLVGCGLAGADIDGNCFEDDPTNTDFANTVAAAASGGGGSGGSSMIPIIAAAAAGVLLIVVIVAIIIIRKRKAGPTTPSGRTDRTVVAFENPMYDDPKDVNPSSYDNPHDAEGLYDEPAFNDGSNKVNPVYEEGDAEPVYNDADGGADGGGYLDVAPDDDE